MFANVALLHKGNDCTIADDGNVSGILGMRVNMPDIVMPTVGDLISQWTLTHRYSARIALDCLPEQSL